MSKYLKTDTDEIYDGISRNKYPDWEGWVIIDGCKKWDNYESFLNDQYIPCLHDAVDLIK